MQVTCTEGRRPSSTLLPRPLGSSQHNSEWVEQSCICVSSTTAGDALLLWQHSLRPLLRVCQWLPECWLRLSRLLSSDDVRCAWLSDGLNSFSLRSLFDKFVHFFCLPFGYFILIQLKRIVTMWFIDVVPPCFNTDWLLYTFFMLSQISY